MMKREIKLFNQYCEEKGSNIAVADALGISASFVTQIRQGNKRISPRVAALIDADTLGRYPKEKLVSWD